MRSLRIVALTILAAAGCSPSETGPPAATAMPTARARPFEYPVLDIEGEVTLLSLADDRTNTYRIGVRLTNTTRRPLRPPKCTFSPNDDQTAPLEWLDQSTLPPRRTERRVATARFPTNVSEVYGCYFDCRGRAGME